MLLWPIEAQLEMGMCLQDYASFIGTPEGVAMLKARGKLVRVEEGQFAFVPAGWFVQPLYFRLRSNEKGWRNMWNLAVWNSSFYTGVSARAMSARNSYSAAYVLKMSQSMASFKARHDEFTAFFQAQAAETG